MCSMLHGGVCPPITPTMEGTHTTITHSRSKTASHCLWVHIQWKYFTARYRYRLPAKAKAGGRAR
jgi:hypothetical protein